MTAGKQAAERKGNEASMCRYDLKHEAKHIKMMINCKECKAAADLKDPRCMTGVLRALSSELNVDYIVLSHYVETMYRDAAIDMLRKLVQTTQELDQLSIRDPMREYFGEAAGAQASQVAGQDAICRKCPMNPQLIFPVLKTIFLSDIMQFYKSFVDTAQNIRPPYQQRGCVDCTATTTRDFVYMYNYLETLRSFILYQAYRIII